ncbi:hypothetical protein KDM41_01740 [bacterium]|nr:hypothetical protein [bacterium]
MIRRNIAMVLALALVVVAAGCSVDTELGGSKIPNARPDTRITGQPPTLLEASFAVQFNWTGSDPDGRIVGYQWKISDNGVDGISPRDTLTVDPLTGAVLHPWNFTTANDSTFLVLADQSGFPGDTTSPRSFRSHTIFVRAMDDRGAVDPTPAMMSFTATTLVPVARAVYPNLNSQGFMNVPPTVNMSWSGRDPDFDLRVPTQARFVWKPAINDAGNAIRTRNEYNLYYDEVLSFDDPEWSDWIPYAPLDEDRRVAFDNQPNGEYFLFAVQVQDTAGARSVGLGYQQEVAHVKIFANFYRPIVTLSEPFLGTSQSTETLPKEIAGGQPLNFSWSASAEAYNGRIASYRHGWDLISVNDPNDPGWAVPPGTSEQNRFAEERSFQEGLHTFTVRVVDDSGQVTVSTRTLRVVPFVDPAFQQNLMVIDATVDRLVQNWPDQNGAPRNDESYRNPWWRFLEAGTGGVEGLNWERDWRDHTDEVKFSDLVGYKTVLCYAEFNDTAQRMFIDPDSGMRPISGRDRYVWMTPYQQRGGNLFYVGQSSMESYLEGLPNYMTPIVFNTREETFQLNGQSFVVGFGTNERPDGTRVLRGPLQYPYSTAGIAALDWTAPATKYIYNRQNVTRFDRTPECVGLKGLVLDPAFQEYHLIGPGVVADTIWTEPQIDWHDYVDAAADTMKLFGTAFPFNRDEFIDANITSRSTPIVPQECDPDFSPNGLCVQPMFRGIARFDYIREYRWSRGETDWPSSRWTDAEIADDCGPLALDPYGGQIYGTAKTNGRVFGYMSYKMIQDKPNQKADVFWGFDPYRFDHEESRKAIRWVLQYFGLQINQ